MIVGRNGMAVVLSAEAAHLLETSRLTPTELRVRLRGRRPELAQEFLDLRAAAMSFDPGALPPETETEAAQTEMAAECERWMTAAEAADQLDVTPRRVRQLCDAGVIQGAELFGGRWRISRDGLKDYKAARAA